MALLMKAKNQRESLIDEANEYEMTNLHVAAAVDDEQRDDSHYLAVSPSAASKCRIVDEILSTRAHHPVQFAPVYSTIFLFLVFCATGCCNGFLIYYAYKFIVDPQHDPTTLLYIAGVGLAYLMLCGLWQILNYPEHKSSLNDLQCVIDELVASYPKIKMHLNGCNLFVKNRQTGTFDRIYTHSIATDYEYHRVIDASSNFDEVMNALIGHPNNHWNIIEFNIDFEIRCGDEATSTHYLETRRDFINTHCKASTQTYMTSAVYCNEIEQAVGSVLVGDAPLRIGQSKRVWIINDNSYITNCFIQDTVYWIFCVFLFSQWLYVLIAYMLVSKKQTFTVCKDIYYDPPARDAK